MSDKVAIGNQSFYCPVSYPMGILLFKKDFELGEAVRSMFAFKELV